MQPESPNPATNTRRAVCEFAQILSESGHASLLKESAERDQNGRRLRARCLDRGSVVGGGAGPGRPRRQGLVMIRTPADSLQRKQLNANRGVQTKKGSLFRGFQVFATKASVWLGTKWAFAGALMLIIGWASVGPHFRYSDTWQLVVNTTTTIVTFLMVFLIQNTQNRDAKAIHLKLDEIIRANRRADNEMIDVEKLSDEELEQLAGQFEQISAACVARKRLRKAS